MEQAARQGLPPGVRFELVGRGTDKIPGLEGLPPGNRAHGSVEEERLTDLLTRACALVAPVTSGFGAMTRLPEAGVAGIPVLTTPLGSLAAGDLPGVRPLPLRWDVWAHAMGELARGKSDLPRALVDVPADAEHSDGLQQMLVLETLRLAAGPTV